MTRKKNVVFRIDDDALGAIRDVAAASGVTVSEWIRRTVTAASSQKDERPSQYSTPHPQPQKDERPTPDLTHHGADPMTLEDWLLAVTPPERSGGPVPSSREHLDRITSMGTLRWLLEEAIRLGLFDSPELLPILDVARYYVRQAVELGEDPGRGQSSGTRERRQYTLATLRNFIWNCWKTHATNLHLEPR